MAREKDAAHETEAHRQAEDCGEPHGNGIPLKKRRLDVWYPRIMTVLLALNLLLQILILAFRWYRL